MANTKKYSPDIIDDLKSARRLAACGYLDYEVAKFLKVSKTTIKNWKKEHHEFAELLQEFRDGTVNTLEKVVFQMATGAIKTWEEKSHVIDGVPRIVKHRKKHLPNIASTLSLLRILHPEKWGDVMQGNNSAANVEAYQQLIAGLPQ